MLERIQIDLSDLPDLHRKYACQFASVTMIGSDRSRLVHAIAGGVDHQQEIIGAAERIWVYYRLMTVWWAVRFLRHLMEAEQDKNPVTDPALAQQFSQRLALRPVDDVAVTRQKYDYYRTLAITQTGKTML